MKQRILQKATDLFLNLGFKSVTMDDLASAMAISKKTIYVNYQTKTRLVEACTFYLFDLICTDIDSVKGNSANPIEELYGIKNVVMRKLKNEKTSPQYQLKKYYPKIYTRLKNKQFEVMHESIIDNLEQGKSKGLFRADLDTDFVSRIYFSVMTTALKDTALFPANRFEMPVLMESYLEYHIRSISTPKGISILNQFLIHNTA